MFANWTETNTTQNSLNQYIGLMSGVDNPATVNQSPYGEGWMIRIRPSDPKEFAGLLSPSDYEKLVEEQHA